MPTSSRSCVRKLAHAGTAWSVFKSLNASSWDAVCPGSQAIVRAFQVATWLQCIVARSTSPESERPLARQPTYIMGPSSSHPTIDCWPQDVLVAFAQQSEDKAALLLCESVT